MPLQACLNTALSVAEAENCSIPVAIGHPATFLAAAMALWNSSAITTAAGGVAQSFSLTLTGSTAIVLRASHRAFTPLTTAALSHVSCNVSAVSSDGAWAVVLTPTPEEPRAERHGERRARLRLR